MMFGRKYALIYSIRYQAEISSLAVGPGWPRRPRPEGPSWKTHPAKRPDPGICLSHARRLTQRKQHRSDHGNMIAVAGKSTDLDVFGALPLDALSGVGLRQLAHPSQYFLLGGLTGPMQSITASDDRSLNNLRIGGSKEDGPPNHSISPVDHCVPPITPDQMSPCCLSPVDLSGTLVGVKRECYGNVAPGV
jgi:hypothetical protein